MKDEMKLIKERCKKDWEEHYSHLGDFEEFVEKIGILNSSTLNVICNHPQLREFFDEEGLLPKNERITLKK